MTPNITTTGGMPTILLPLSFIVLMNGAKDALEDWRRHKSDRAENERATLRISDKTSGKKEGMWSTVEVGDYIIVQQNEYVPADLILLTSANADGQAFIETANLDGETNLKTKQAADNIFSAIGYNEELEAGAKAACAFEGSIVCEGPNASLYTFVGTLTMAKNQEKIPLDERHMILRGCKIKNVKWCLGVVVYTGKESKIMMNSQAKIGRKLSHLERDLSKFTGVMFSFQAILCLIAAIVSAFFDTSDENKAKTYLNLTDGPDKNYEEKFGFFLVLVFRFFNFLILFMNFIPISLLVSVSIVKLIQVYFIYCDRDMIYEGIHCMPRTSDLNEEMGQVEYVFSDKTGTLTQNIMDFRKFCVNGVQYGEGMTEIRRNVLIKMGKEVPEEPQKKPGARRTPHVDLVDDRLDQLLASGTSPQYFAVRTCLLHLAIIMR
jgi:phospholipid-transporting ATPase